jgi:hypothetical protein
MARRGDAEPTSHYVRVMGVKLRRLKRVAAGVLAAALTGVLAVSAVQPAQAAKTRKRTDLVPGTFRVASFNVLGASHTPPGGKRASGETRIVWANQLLQRNHVDVAGFQELQSPQLTKLMSITDGSWDFYPGLSLKRIDSENSIGWRTDKFTKVDATTVNIPYFNGSPRAMPVVLLRDKASGMLTYFANFHNPADTSKYHHQGVWRAEATKIEIALQNQLVSRGIPRIMTGDMNDRAPYYCAVTAGAQLKAARPESYWRNGTCYANKPRAVDWILGSKRATYSNYVEDRSPLVGKTTDHPVIVTTVTVTPEQLINGWQVDPPAPLSPRRTWTRH